MRYFVILEGNQPAGPPPAELMDAIMRLGAEANQAGVLVDAQGLAPSAGGATVAVHGGDLSVTDGPFAESKEMISYSIYDVRTKEDAVEWTSRFMQLHRDLWPGWEGVSRVVPVFDPAGAPPGRTAGP